MNKKELLNEILQENPEISREKMEEILDILLENNPKIEVNKDFKNKLRLRLENIWNYERKNFFQKYFQIFVPAFSAVWIFVIFSFFYFDSFDKEQNFSEKKLFKNDIEFENKNFENIKILKTSLDLEKFEWKNEKLENDLKSFQNEEFFDRVPLLDDWQKEEKNLQNYKMMNKTFHFQNFKQNFEIKNLEKSISLDELKKIIDENKNSRLLRDADNKEIFWVVFRVWEITWWVDFLDFEMENLTSEEIIKDVYEKISSMLKNKNNLENSLEIIWLKYINL